MAYKRPNRKAPRVRTKTTRIMNQQMLRDFKEKHPEYQDLTLVEYNGILKQFNQNIIDEVIENRYGVSLPERLGHLIIVSFPRPKRKIIDFGTSNKTGVLSYHGNWDTDNRLGKIVFQNNGYGASFTFHNFWGFTPSRGFKEKMSVAFKKLWQKYIHVDNKGTNIRTIINGK